MAEPASRTAVADPPPPAAGADPSTSPGWRQVLTVATAVVAAVFGAQVVTSALPPAWQDLLFRTPLAIVLLAAGTVGLLARIARREASSRPR